MTLQIRINQYGDLYRVDLFYYMQTHLKNYKFELHKIIITLLQEQAF